LLAAVFVLFAFALTKSITTMVSLTQAVATPGAEAARSRHISVFLPEQATLFFQHVRNGVLAAADDYDIAVSFHPIGPGTSEFRLAQYTGIDGAIIYPYLPEEEVLLRLEELDARDIPVVLVEQDVADDWPWTFVGTNNFEMGRRIGTRLLQRDDHEQIVVVYSDKSPAVAAERELIELGITTAMGDRLNAPIARRQTDLNPLDAEAVTYQLLRSPSTRPITAIVFTDTNDTLAALQTIINLNLVGQVQVIGFGVTDAIMDYLERGVLNATIAVNPERIGVEAVRVLAELIRTGNAPGYVDTGVEVIRGTQ
jgi:ribose transport system substrate-binding protein